MRTEAEIKELKEHLVADYYANRLNQQKLDESYYTDNFTPTLLRNADYLAHTGRARRMVDKPVEHIISLTPQFFRDTIKKGRADADTRVAAEGNRWVRKLSAENPNPFWEFARNLMLRGEGWFYVVHNDNLPIGWQQKEVEAMPIRFLVPDPITVFADPFLPEVDGIPGAVIISRNESVYSVQQRYPEWRKGSPGKHKVPFFMYVDSGQRYIEADNETIVFDENIYGIVPLVHSYSGFGRETHEGDPATLAFGRLKPCRKLLENECQIESDFSYVVDKYSYQVLLILTRGGETINQDKLQEFNMRGPRIGQLDIPPDASIEKGISLSLTPELLNYRAQIKAELDMEDPPLPSGSTGRHEDIVWSSWRKRFDPVADRAAKATSTAFGLGLRICDTLADWLPPGLKKGDIDGRYDCRIELKADDPIENDRRSLLGRTLYNERQIDLKTNLVKYQGMTEEEADDVIAHLLVDGVTIQSPIVAQILGQRFVKEHGLEEEAAALAQAQGTQEEIQKAGIGSLGGEPRTMNVKTPLGQEMADMLLTQRGERRTPTEVMR